MFIPRLAHRSIALCLLSGSALWPNSQPTVASLGNLPLAFVRQGDQFSARGQGYFIGLDSGTATIQVVSQKTGDTERFVSIGFPGGQNAAPVPGPKLSGVVNYITGKDPQKWQIGLPTVDRVTYPEVYPGIDVVYYGNQQQLEFDLVVKPGADPRAIRMKVRGGGRLSIDSDGALEVGSVEGLRIALPKIYQEASGIRKNIAGHFSIRGTDEVAFHVDAWDRTRPLIIDPTIVYSTLLGGALSGTSSVGIAIDSSRNVLIAGYTSSADFPTVNAAQTNYAGTDAFVSKLNPDGTALIYSTFFGGTFRDAATAIAVDSTGAAWVTGSSSSSDFPLLNAAQQSSLGAFLLKLDAAGIPQFSTRVGNPSAVPYGIAVDPAGNGYVTGATSSGFPTTTGVVQSSTNGFHAFVAKYSPSGTVIYATMLGGAGQDYGYGIAADSNGDAYVTGVTSSSNFVGAPAGGAQTTNRGNGDAFVAKLKSDGTALLYFTFLGGSSADQGTAIVVDSSLNAYVTGQTGSVDLATPGAAQTTMAGALDGFVAKVNPAGNAFGYITYLGGSRQEFVHGMTSDASGNIYVTGFTKSPDFPTVNPIQESIAANTASLFITGDSGGSWTSADTGLPGAVIDLTLNPGGSTGVASTYSGVFRTTDGGSNWTRQLIVPDGARTTLSRSLANPSTIYAVSCCGSLVAQSAAVYQSTDDGVTWTASPAPGNFENIVADPQSANTVYFWGSSNFWKSTDGGATWSQQKLSGQGTIAGVIAASNGALYAAVGASSPRGSTIYKSTNHGVAWSPLNVGLPYYTNFFSSYPLSASGNSIYVAAGTIYKSTDGGEKWTSSTGPEAIYELEVSPKNPSLQYAVTGTNTVRVSSDGGVTWDSPSATLPPITPGEIVPDPSDTSRAFLTSGVNSAVFVTKLNSTGSSFVWSTLLGGSSTASGSGIATDGAGSAWVTGTTGSVVFPVTATPFPGTSVFITKISDATADCSPLLTANDQTITGSSQKLAFSVVAPSGCNWSTSSDSDWAVITSGASAAGTAVVRVQVAENTGVTARTATLQAGSKSVRIVQAGSSCSYSLDLPPAPFSADPPAYGLPTAGGNVTAVLTATDGCPWTVVNPFPTAVTVTSGSSGVGSGTIQLTVTPNNVTNAGRVFSLPVATTAIRIEQMYQPPLDQIIDFGSISDQTLDFAPPPLAATASSGIAVTFTSDTPAVCQVSGATVTLSAAGTCSITANQGGNVRWLPAPPVTRTFAVTAGPAVPQPAGIVNAAYGGAAPSVVGIGSYVAIYGHALAGHAAPSATTIPLPASLNGTQATLGGVPMPLLYAASGQVNAIVPMALTPGQSYPLVVTRDGIPSPAVALRAVQLLPAIYTVGATGYGIGIVTSSLTGALIGQSNPATAGEYLTIYCNGLGPVHGPNGEPGPADGAGAPLDRLYSTNATVSVSLQGFDTPVLFSGLTPSLVGLYQVNVQVPSGLVAGFQSLTMYLTVRDQQTGAIAQSNTVIVFVK